MMSSAAPLSADVRQDRAGKDQQRDQCRERARRECDRAVEACDALKAAHDAQYEVRPQPERKRPQDAFAVDREPRHGTQSSRITAIEADRRGSA